MLQFNRIRRPDSWSARLFLLVAAIASCTLPGCAAVGLTTAPSATAPLRTSSDGRWIVNEDGRPFFYLADTAWELFHRLDREEAGIYLQDRAAKGFTVIQAVVLAELDGLNTPNAYGQTPLIGNDPEQANEECGGFAGRIPAGAAVLPDRPRRSDQAAPRNYVTPCVVCGAVYEIVPASAAAA